MRRLGKAAALGTIVALGALGMGAELRTTFSTEPESAWNKRAGDFQVRLSVSTQAREFIRAWDNPSRPPVPEVSEASSIRREIEFGAFILFSNCPVADDGTCDVRVTYQVISESGRLLVKQPNLPLWTSSAPQRDTVQLGQCLWFTASEYSDPLGSYRLRAIVVDKTTGARVTLERTFRLT